jgi:DNA-binding NarL/FixJ family response regulator
VVDQVSAPHPHHRGLRPTPVGVLIRLDHWPTGRICRTEEAMSHRGAVLGTRSGVEVAAHHHDGRAVRMVTVLLADPDRLVRTGLAMVVGAEPGLRVIGVAVDGADAVQRTRIIRPDVVLIDVPLLGADGIEAVRRIVTETASRVLVVTTERACDGVRAAMLAGARGCLLKDAAPRELGMAARAVAAGDVWLDPKVAGELLPHVLREQMAIAPPERSGAPELTDREREVLRLMAHGLSNVEIAAHLLVAETTVKTHVGRILGKLGLRDRAQAVAAAYRRQLLATDDPLPPRTFVH